MIANANAKSVFSRTSRSVVLSFGIVALSLLPVRAQQEESRKQSKNETGPSTVKFTYHKSVAQNAASARVVLGRTGLSLPRETNHLSGKMLGLDLRR